jgi:hypothetical protein
MGGTQRGLVPAPCAVPMCAVIVENGLVDFDQVETSDLTTFPADTLFQKKRICREEYLAPKTFGRHV